MLVHCSGLNKSTSVLPSYARDPLGNSMDDYFQQLFYGREFCLHARS